jgi:hypothetical protein
MRLLLLTLAAAIILSGCFGGRSADPTPDPTRTPTYDVARPFSVGLNATGCGIAAILFLVEPAQAQRSLPPGFRAADVGRLLGTADTGKAAFFLEAWQCDRHELAPAGLRVGEVSIYVEPPTVEGAQGQADDHFYYHSIYSDNETFLEVVRAANITTDEGRIELSMGTQPSGGSQGSARVRDPELVLFTLGWNAPAQQPLDTRARLWHVSPDGVSYFDYHLQTTAVAGSGSCTARPGSGLAEALGVTSCPPGSAVGLVAPRLDWKASFHFLPNATAA